MALTPQNGPEILVPQQTLLQGLPQLIHCEEMTKVCMIIQQIQQLTQAPLPRAQRRWSLEQRKDLLLATLVLVVVVVSYFRQNKELVVLV